MLLYFSVLVLCSQKCYQVTCLQCSERIVYFQADFWDVNTTAKSPRILKIEFNVEFGQLLKIVLFVFLSNFAPECFDCGRQDLVGTAPQ